MDIRDSWGVSFSLSFRGDTTRKLSGKVAPPRSAFFSGKLLLSRVSLVSRHLYEETLSVFVFPHIFVYHGMFLKDRLYGR